MAIQIIGNVDKNRLICTGSFTKLLTTYVNLSLLSEKYDLAVILDDPKFFDTLCTTDETKAFLTLFQNLIGGQFSLHDICSYYTGLPYTFDVAADEIEKVDAGQPFKHHSILDEKTFLDRCRNNITAVYTDQCKFHYSEVSIIFLGYFLEKVYDLKIETLYQKYVIDKFKLPSSIFSRKRTANLYCQDLSDEYDYPSIAILDHGYFCYSNGFFTTLSDMQILLENLLNQPVFQFMTDIKHARAASNRLLNGLTVELRLVGDDIIYGYEGLSFSGCNLWAYSTKQKKGFITFSDSEEEVYPAVYDQLGYSEFDKVPEFTEIIYKNFIKKYNYTIPAKDTPAEYQGNYQRVVINEKVLTTLFTVGSNFIVIRNPDEVRYEVIFANGCYRTKNKDNTHGSKVGFIQAKSGNRYFYYDGNLYKKV